MIHHICLDAGGHKVARRITDRKEYFSIRNSEENCRNFAQARQGDVKAKPKLAQFNYNDQLPNGVLRGCCHAASTFAHDIDCRSQEECQEIARRLLDMKEELGLVELSVSPNWGLHAVSLRQLGLTILENQVRLSMLTKTEMDTNTHDQQRVMFTGPADEQTLLFLDDRIFDEPLSLEQGAEEFQRTKEREQKGEEEVPAGAKKANKHYRPWEDSVSREALKTAVVVQTAVPADASEAFTPADARIRFLAKGIIAEKGLLASDFIKGGARHNTVKMFLSGATQLLTKAEANGMLSELMPNNWRDQNIQSLVNDFYAKYCNPNQRLLRYQEELFAKSLRLADSQPEQPADIDETKRQPVYGDKATLAEIYASQQPPLPPLRLPGLVKAATSQTPQEMKATVAQAMFPPLGAYPRELKFYYIDHQYRELRMSCLIVAETGSGKDTSTRQPLKHITAPMKARDAVNRQRLREFNEQYNTKAANKEKPQRPKDMFIQCVSANLTAARLAQLMDDAQGAFIYTRLHEFEQWYGVEGKTGSACTFLNLKLADDEDNPFGQERAGAQSVNYTGPLNLNWNASTTLSKVQNMFRNVMVDGPLSRLCLSTTPNLGLAAPIPVYGKFDEKYDEALRPYIDNLMAATGEYNCRQAYRLAEQLKAECDQFIQKTQDEVFDNLTHRALVHTFRKACLLYVANGMKWEKAIEGFCRWSLHYDLWLKMHFFGDLIRNANGEVRTSHRGPRNLLDLLPQEFKLQDAVNVRQQQGMNAEGAKNMLYQWVHRGYILQLTVDSFKKVQDTGKSSAK